MGYCINSYFDDSAVLELLKPKSLDLFAFSYYFSKIFLSNILNPLKYRLSLRRSVLIYLSIGEELDKLGLAFTSSSHGLRSESSKISKPKISKQVDLYLSPPELVTKGCSAEIMVLIRTCFILSKTYL